MTSTPTDQFVASLQGLKSGDLARLRSCAGLPLSSSVDAFDLFAGLWWPLRQKTARAPRREVAWLVAKLYAHAPIPHKSGATIARQLGSLRPSDERCAKRVDRKFDELLMRSVSEIEPALQWALRILARNGEGVDWGRLVDELSAWEGETPRLKWANEYMHTDTATRQ